jgi:glycosyltransferase involved in cell wall biosynthesis
VNVSVVIPLFDTERFVREAVESLLGQERQPVEVIVVDDGSTDAGPKLVESFGAPVRLVRQAHRGIAAARNRGVREATGEALAFLDADDIAPPRRLAMQAKALEEDRELDGVVGVVEEFMTPGVDGVSPAEHRGPRPPRVGRMAGSLLIWRDSFLRVGEFDETTDRAEVLDWFARAADMGLRLGGVPEVVLLRRLHDTNHGMRVHAKEADYLKALRASIHRRRQ